MSIAKTTIHLRCDRCNKVNDEPFEFWTLEGDEAIHAVDQAAEDRGWLADGFEHFCEGCRDEHQREMAEEYEPDAAHESRLMDRDNARDINAGRI